MVMDEAARWRRRQFRCGWEGRHRAVMRGGFCSRGPTVEMQERTLVTSSLDT